MPISEEKEKKGENLMISKNKREVEKVLEQMASSLSDLCAEVDLLAKDKRWAAIGKTRLQEGLAALRRALSNLEYF